MPPNKKKKRRENTLSFSSFLIHSLFNELINIISFRLSRKLDDTWYTSFIHYKLKDFIVFRLWVSCRHCHWYWMPFVSSEKLKISLCRFTFGFVIDPRNWWCESVEIFFLSFSFSCFGRRHFTQLWRWFSSFVRWA